MEWNTVKIKKRAALRGRIRVDAAVVGGGFTGLTTALWLCRAGLRVALVEAETIGYGASGNCCGILSPCKGSMYAELEEKHGISVAEAYAHTHLKAILAIEELCTRQGILFPIRRIPASVIPLTTDIESLEKELEAMKRAGLSAGMEPAGDCPFPAKKVLRIEPVYVMDSYTYMTALADQAERLGVQIFEHSRVTGVEADAVYTANGSILAPYMVIATGYPIVNTPGWYFIRLEQRSASLVRLSGERIPTSVFIAQDGSFALCPQGQNVLMQTNGRFVGSRKQFAKNRAFIDCEKYLDARQMETGKEAIETYSSDGLPFIGPYSAKTPSLFVGTGYGGNGLAGSMIAAQAISARILGLPSDGYEIYQPQRSLQGMKLPLKMSVRYAKGMFGGAETPRCSHMGCRLNYNPSSRLWECPCHGSRFDGIGRVINAPATRAAQLRGRR